MAEDRNNVIRFSGPTLKQSVERLGAQRREILHDVVRLISTAADGRVGEDLDALRGAAKTLLALARAEARLNSNFITAIHEPERLPD